MCVMMGSAILVADVVKEVCIGTHPWQCWLASFLYVVDLEMLRTCKSVPTWDRNWYHRLHLQNIRRWSEIIEGQDPTSIGIYPQVVAQAMCFATLLLENHGRKFLYYWPFAKPYWMQSFAAKEHHSPGLFSLDRHAAKLVLLEMFLCPDTRKSGIAGRLSNRFWRRCLQYAYQHIGKTRQGWKKVAYKGLVKELSLCWWISKVKPKGFIWFH